MKQVQPKVFLVGETSSVFMLAGQPGQPGLADYLSEVGAPDWSTDAQTDAERLPEVMGRLCYRSWAPGLNPNVTKVREGNDVYLKNVIASQHGSVLEHTSLNFIFHDVSRVFCYTEEAEVFTRHGWKRVASLTTDDELLTMDPETKHARWSRPESVHSFDYCGDVLKWSNSQMTAPRMTPDHLLWAAPYDKRRARGLSNEENVAAYAEKVPAREAFALRFSIDHGVRLENPENPETMRVGDFDYDTYDLMSWLGWMSTDGGFVASRPNQCVIVQSKQAHIPQIDALMDRLFLDRWRRHGPYESGDQIQFVISDAALAEFARGSIGPSKIERRFAPWIFSLHSRLLRGFFDAAMAGDGNTHAENGHQVLYCPSEIAAGQWQVIVSMLGMCANVREDDRTGSEHDLNGQTVRHTRPCFVVSISRKAASLVRHEMKHSEHYTGKVYCPKTADGLVFVRGTGLPFWCGNTHELVRHRVGTGISQESLRYVRLDELRAWMPECFAQDEWAAAKFQEVFEYLEQTQKELAEHFKIDDIKDFATKKKLTSAFRRLAPIGLATSIGWSANIRTLRFVLQQRTSRHAEEEIRFVFNEVGKIVSARYPNLFADFQRETVDGLGEWTSPYAKA